MWLSSVRLRNRRRIDAWTNLCWKTLNNARWRMNFENLGNYHVELKIFARSACEFCWILVNDSVENCEKHWILELEKELSSFYTWLLPIGNYALIVFKWCELTKMTTLTHSFMLSLMDLKWNSMWILSIKCGNIIRMDGKEYDQ